MVDINAGKRSICTHLDEAGNLRKKVDSLLKNKNYNEFMYRTSANGYKIIHLDKEINYFFVTKEKCLKFKKNKKNRYNEVHKNLFSNNYINGE